MAFDTELTGRLKRNLLTFFRTDVCHGHQLTAGPAEHLPWTAAVADVLRQSLGLRRLMKVAASVAHLQEQAAGLGWQLPTV